MNKPKKTNRADQILAVIEQVIGEAQALEKEFEPVLERVHPDYRVSAANLLHYRAFRKHDLRETQKKLGNMGLSRLAKSQSHVLASLQTNRAILQSIRDQKPISLGKYGLSFKEGSKRLKDNAKKLLGYRSKNRRTRIMVTMPGEAAENFQLVKDMIESGMNCARINCAHDDHIAWKKIIDHVREASGQLGKKCKIAMDLAGPKIRTGSLKTGPSVRKIRVAKNLRGEVEEPTKVWIGPSPHENYPQVPIREVDIEILKGVKNLYFRDARKKKRHFEIIREQDDGFIAHCWQTSFIESDILLHLDARKAEEVIFVGDIPPVEMALSLSAGDWLRLDRDQSLAGGQGATSHISCTAPAIFEQVKTGERILFDDGKIEGVIKKVQPDYLDIKILYAAGGTAKLRADKGINLPDSHLTIRGLTDKDRRDLPFVAEHADVVNFSFVHRPEDVRELLTELETLGAREKIGLILKIETQNGFNQLTEILLEAMQVYPVGVMIARGDLAIETGWENIGRVQEEILSLCQAAHVTDIWATQVLEGLAKRGIPSRAEITDAVMAQRADCVMLNKGPFILDAIRLLDTILVDMEPYWEKNAPLSPMMDKADIHSYLRDSTGLDRADRNV